MEFTNEQANKLVEVMKQEIDIEFPDEIDRDIAAKLIFEITQIFYSLAYLDRSGRLQPICFDLSDIRFIKAFRLFCNMIEAKIDAVNRNKD